MSHPVPRPESHTPRPPLVDKGEVVPQRAVRKHSQVGDARARLLENPHDRAVPASPLPAIAQRVMVGAFVLMLVFALVWIAQEHWRRGASVLGGGLVYLAVIRWLVDSRIMGVLAVRSRKFDSIFTALLGMAMLWIAISVDPLGS